MAITWKNEFPSRDSKKSGLLISDHNMAKISWFYVSSLTSLSIAASAVENHSMALTKAPSFVLLMPPHEWKCRI